MPPAPPRATAPRATAPRAAAPVPDFRYADWLQDDAVQRVFALLGASETRLVGGCVRDALLGLAVANWDFATRHQPQETLKRLRGERVKTSEVGLRHGTVVAHIGGRAFEITSLRRDVRPDGRHSAVQFGGTWKSDAARRDFTVNALYVSADGKLHDPLGTGLADMRARRLRFIGSPSERLKEDYLRVLRFFRMHYLLRGERAPSRAELKALEAHAPGLAQLSPERVRAEIWKLLALPHFVDALEAMQTAQILAQLLPPSVLGGLNFARARELEAIGQAQFFAPDPLLHLAALLPHAEAAAQLGGIWHLSKAEQKYLREALQPGERLVSYLSLREVRRLLYRWGVAAFRARALLAWAEDKHPRKAIFWRAMLAMAENWQRPRLPLTGAMMRAAGVPQGPAMTRIKKEVERWWVDSDFIDDKFSIIERLKAIVQATLY